MDENQIRPSDLWKKTYWKVWFLTYARNELRNITWLYTGTMLWLITSPASFHTASYVMLYEMNPVHVIKINFTIHIHSLEHHTGRDTKM
jgi:hypothetical protein